MAKLTKNQLKSIVKECLVEILSEGLAQTNDVMFESSNRRSPALNKDTSGTSKRKTTVDQAAFRNATQKRAASITDDPIMQSILADTARTTLQEQTRADRVHGTPMQETAAPGQNIEELPIFAEGAQNWAALAFAEKKLP